jgi:hypothetical protein
MEQQTEEDELLIKLRHFFNLKPTEHDYVREIQEKLYFYYIQLALIARNRGDYDACLLWCEYLRLHNPDYSCHHICLCYYHLLTGQVCEHLGQLTKAWCKYEKA